MASREEPKTYEDCMSERAELIRRLQEINEVLKEITADVERIRDIACRPPVSCSE